MCWSASKNTADPGGCWGSCVLCGDGGEGRVPEKVEDIRWGAWTSTATWWGAEGGTLSGGNEGCGPAGSLGLE